MFENLTNHQAHLVCPISGKTVAGVPHLDYFFLNDVRMTIGPILDEDGMSVWLHKPISGQYHFMLEMVNGPQ